MKSLTKYIIPLGIAMAVLIAFSTTGSSDFGILVEEWHYDMHWYWDIYRANSFGSSPAIADLGPDINNEATEPDSNLEIVTGSDETWGPTQDGVASRGVWRTFDSDGNLEWQRGTQNYEARSSPAIIDIDGDGDLEIVGGTTSGCYVQVMDHQGNFVWTFPTLVGSLAGPPIEWHSSPAVADLDDNVSGLEVVIGNNSLGNVWCFDGDNSDGLDEGITIDFSDFSPWGFPLGTEGTDWDVLWKFDTGGPVVASPAIGDVDNDGDLEVVIGSTDGYVYVLDGPTGSLEYTFSMIGGGAVYASAALANLDDDPYLEIVIGSTAGMVHCVQWTGLGGNFEWTYTTGGSVYSSAAIGDIDGDGDLEVVVGSNDGKIYAHDGSGVFEWSYSTGGDVYSSPSLARRQGFLKYSNEWPMFRNNPARTGVYGGAKGSKLGVYVGSDDGYFYLIDGSNGLLIDRFQVYTGTYDSSKVYAVHTSAAIADVDGDLKLEIFFYDWGLGSIYNGNTFWAVEDVESQGHEMDCFEVNYMNVIDRKMHGGTRDTINIWGSLKLAEEAVPFDPEVDVVTATINGEEITIPAGYFEERIFWCFHYYWFKGDVPGVGHVHMHLNFDLCSWWINISGKEAIDLVECEGAAVGLSIGSNVGEDSFDWTKKWEKWGIGSAKFIEWPPIHCCPICWKGN